MASQPPPLPSSLPVSDVVTATWPKRTAKACTSCRRDKIRCDGAKPCGACVKKGYTADQCTDGCESCRRARVRCEGGKPCLRCRDMHLECAEEQAMSLARSEMASPILVLRSSRRRGERAKLACMSCRRDNKKCDDQRPCSRCVARSEECVHVARGPKLVKLRCESCRQENRKCEESRPCQQCVEQGKECVNVQRRSRGHGTRVKTACTNCRRDKVRCEGIRPCTTCVKKGYQCTDQTCMICIHQEIEGDCPHRSITESDTSEPSVSELNHSFPSPHHSHPTQSPTSHTSPASGPPVFQNLHMYGTTQCHVSGMLPLPGSGMPDHHHQVQGQHNSSSPTGGFSRANYYPVIDPQIDVPQPQANISSERYHPSSATADPL
ncbi:hypothetical protein EDC04DRAFT_3089265 [Pisolithus marmoratus]|nr:hypothetical protein EDC04DRAFT_3089265 [Pisolithus marmoratus]